MHRQLTQAVVIYAVAREGAGVFLNLDRGDFELPVLSQPQKRNCAAACAEVNRLYPLAGFSEIREDYGIGGKAEQIRNDYAYPVSQRLEVFSVLNHNYSSYQMISPLYYIKQKTARHCLTVYSL